MAAVITDIPPRRRSERPTRLLAPVPELSGPDYRGSVRLLGVPPSAEVRRSARVPRPAQPGAGRVVPPSRVTGRVGTAPDAYRLRRTVALLVVVGLVLTAWLGLEALAGALGVSQSPSSVSATPSPVTIEVAPGDTFWSIASRIQPQGDLRPLIDRLVASHGGRVLQAGDHLSVPRS